MNFIKAHKGLFITLVVIVLISVAGLTWGKSLNSSSLMGDLSANIKKNVSIKKNVNIKKMDLCQNKCSAGETCIKLECGTSEFFCSPKTGPRPSGDAECIKRGYGAPVQQGDFTRADMVKAVVLASPKGSSCVPSATPTYTDVLPGTWYYDYVGCAVQLGWLNSASGVLKPDEFLNRAEVIKFIVTALGVPKVAGQTEPYTDVMDGAWFQGYVAAAYQAGLVLDSGDHLFHPSDLAMRQWSADVLARVVR